MPELTRLERSMPFRVGVASAYLLLNTSLNMLNRWALGQYRFRFPILLTAAHMLFGSVVMLPMMMIKEGYRGTHMSNWRKDWKALLFIGAVNGPQIALNNASLISIELSLNQVIRAGIPVCVACFAFCLERRVPTEIGLAYLLLVTLSVMCVVFTGHEHGELFGVGMCALSVMMQSAQMSLSGRLMSGKLDSFQLNFYTGPVAFAVLVMMEMTMHHEAAGLLRFAVHKPLPTTFIVLGGCCLALMYNVVLMQAVRTFSSVGTAVLGNFRTVLLIFASAMLLGELKDWSGSRYIGCVNTFVGAAAYGLHPKLFGTPVSRELPKNAKQEIEEVRKDALAEGPDEEETSGLACEGRSGGDRLIVPAAEEEDRDVDEHL
eukprot:CAMPEP_0174707490 /NCGR_PEP_ID=MMETSP1094-20130205/9988_1 /TAXON_ID=156173 /ORGANISM="Chrysochromulina brevifilum, Strain UTEX LB 985" /LENGTH=374 /DNA_ID=CAMNT_0015905877 /DNA_START=24 /DNA_END=1148 /DNA_ORIENTATION=-